MPRPQPPADPAFSTATFRFLTDLAAHNDRDWFHAHKPRYGNDVVAPALAFIEAFRPRLRKLSPHFLAEARPVGGSLFRIHRDTRFSRDKSPYKTSVGIQFRHERARDVHCPGFYLHLEPRACFMGVGLWHPASDALKRIRDAMVDDPAAWRRAAHRGSFTRRFALDGEALKRAPRGYDPEHPLVEDLKRKDITGATAVTQKVVVAADFVDTFAAACKDGAPVVRWLCGALDVPF